MNRLYSVLILVLSTVVLFVSCSGGGGCETGGGGGGASDDDATAVAIQPDGKIVAAGYSYNGSQYVFALVRYNTDVTLDATFNTTGKVTTAIGTSDDDAFAVAIQSGGKIVAAGCSYNGSQYVFALVRYNTDGTLDTTFNTTGKVPTAIGTSDDDAFAVAIQSDGEVGP